MGLLLKGVGNQVTKDVENAEVYKPFFYLFYWQGLFSDLPGQLAQKQSLEKEKMPTNVGKDQVRFKFLEPHSSFRFFQIIYCVKAAVSKYIYLTVIILSFLN